VLWWAQLSSETLEEVSDDISSNSLPTRLVSIAALLRLISHFPAYLPVTNYRYLTILLCHAKIVNFTRLCSKGTKSAPREPKQDPPKYAGFNLRADFSTVWSGPEEEYARASPLKFFTFLTSEIAYILQSFCSERPLSFCYVYSWFLALYRSS
jgi:hypothetical protein